MGPRDNVMICLLCVLLVMLLQVRHAVALRPTLAIPRQGCTRSVEQIVTTGRLNVARSRAGPLRRLASSRTMGVADKPDSDNGSDIVAVAAQIKDVAGFIKSVQQRVDDVVQKIESTKAALGKEGLSPNQREILVMELQSLMDEKKSLMDKEKGLMDEKQSLMDKEKGLMDEKKGLMKKQEILQEAMGAVYLQMHNKWTRDGCTVGTAGPGQRQKFYLSQDFEKARATVDSYVVDKTAFISKFLATPYVVFRRPRRFGKTFFLSMLEFFFYGATGLFKGLAVYDQTIHLNGFLWCPSDSSKHNWPPFPVVHLDFSSLKKCETADDFSTCLVDLLAAVGKANKCEIDVRKSPNFVLRDLVTGLASQPMNKHKKVVVLIDEYDTPLNDRAIDDDVSKGILSVYTSFFTELKALDMLTSFVYVTGITSYAMAGIYSGANNFLDLTHSASFESMCAITEEELRAAIKAILPQALAMSAEEMAFIKLQYNGYSWNLEPGKRRTLFNSLFVAMYCNTGKLDDYWGQTTSASLVARFPAIASIDFDAQSSAAIKRSTLKQPWFPSDNAPEDCVRNLFEAGYFTVIDVVDGGVDDASAYAANFAGPPDADVKLGVPNEQIRKLFKSNYLFSLFRPIVRHSPPYQAARAALFSGDIVTFFKSLNDILCSLPYQSIPKFELENEWHFFALTALTSMGLGEDLVAEDTSQIGRRDIIFFVNGVIFVVELKVLAKAQSETLENKARAAVEQICEKGYLKSMFVSNRLLKASKVVLVGVVAVTEKKCFAMIATSELSPQSASMSKGASEVELHNLLD